MNKKTIVKAVLLPGIFPRLKSLGAKTQHFSVLLLLLLQSSNLISRNSSVYTRLQETGNVRISEVLADAWQNVKKHGYAADKLAIYSAMIVGIFILVAQTIMLLVSASMSPASASSIFEPASSTPNNDVVLTLLDQIFGPGLGIFGSGAAAVGNTPIHNGFHDMLAFFSTATMVIAVIIIIYNIVTMIGEAAISGTPFGRRFNPLWAPIRLIVALGLLVPLASGLNSAQYITLYIAKIGSGMASVAWEAFASSATDPGRVFVGAPPPTVEYLVRGILLNEICMHAINTVEAGGGPTPSVAGATSLPVTGAGGYQPTVALIEQVGNNLRPAFSSPADLYTEARILARTPDELYFRWAKNNGSRNPQNTCGVVAIPMVPDQYEMANGSTIEISDIAAVQVAYIAEVERITSEVRPVAEELVSFYMDLANPLPQGSRPSPIAAVTASLKQTVNDSQTRLNTAFSSAATNMAASSRPQIFADMTERGWGGAGTWYMRIGQINRQFIEVAQNPPQIRAEINAEDNRPSAWNARWDVIWDNLGFTDTSIADELRSAIIEAESLFNTEISVDPSLISPEHFNTEERFSLNMEEIIRFVFGIRALYDFKESKAANMDPMSGLVAVGHETINRAKFFMYAIVAQAGLEAVSRVASRIPVVGNVVGDVTGAISGVLSVLSPFLFFFIFVGLGVGIILAYVLPMMPFIYFFFAIMSWAMEIFEAIVAMPLWALAHIKIDGDGLSGPLATNGYFLILGIFLRPILITFGLIGGYVIFGAGAFLLHSLYDSVISNINEGAAPDTIGSFVFVVIFAFMCYQLAMVCFKMVDTVPQGILRWIGQGGATPFSDNKQDMGFATQGALIAGAAGLNMLSGSTNGMGAALGGALNKGVDGVGNASRKVGRYMQRNNAVISASKKKP